MTLTPYHIEGPKARFGLQQGSKCSAFSANQSCLVITVHTIFLNDTLLSLASSMRMSTSKAFAAKLVAK